DLIAATSLVVRLEVGAAPVDHQLGDALLRYSVALQGGGYETATQDGDTIADPAYLAQTMRDINDCDALLAKALDDLKQQLDLGAGQSRRRFVENNHFVSAMKQRC